MRENLVRKGFVLAIIGLFIGTSVIPGITVSGDEFTSDDWPTFRHNVDYTGSADTTGADVTGGNDERKVIITSSSGRNVLYVGGTGPNNYTSIQAAINDASDGDTVFVYDDSSPYYENVDVDKSINLVGENRDTTVIEGDGHAVIDISDDGISISGFTIVNNDGLDGIFGNEIGHTSIYNCIIITSGYSVHITSYYASNGGSNSIHDNIIYNSSIGIYLAGSACTNNKVYDNVICNSGNFGVYISDGSFGVYISDGSSNNSIYGNNVHDMQYVGILCYYSGGNNSIYNNTVSNDGEGITISYSSGNYVYNNDVHNNTYGISSAHYDSNYIFNNNVRDCEYGIRCYQSNSNNICDNIVSNTMYGVNCYQSSGNNMSNNSINGNVYGVYLDSSTGNSLFGNGMVGCGIMIVGGSLKYWNSHSIDTSNTVNGKPVYYWRNVNGGTIPAGAGEIILANCTNVTIQNQVLNSTTVGVELGFSTNVTVINNEISYNQYSGVYSLSSDNWCICSSDINDNRYGICCESSDNNNIYHNNINNNGNYGVYCDGGNGNNIYDNVISGNGDDGIYYFCGSNGNIYNNSIGSNGDDGISWYGGHNNNIYNNSIDNNGDDGIYCYSIAYNKIYNNTIYNNSNNGIYCVSSDDNIFYLNSFMGNGRNVYSVDSDNLWNSTSPINYRYNGVSYTSYLGNYWSDYSGTDSDGDGIGEAAYSIDENDEDYYPLMVPSCELFTKPPTADTGGPYYGNPGYPVQFDGRDSYDNDENGQSIVRYDWRFYDGDTWHNNITSRPTYSYANVGNYTVTLRIWDDEGENDTDSDVVYINYLPHPPTADAGGPYHVMEDDLLILDASLSHDNDENGSSIIRYDWKFFDGDTWHNDNGPNPPYIYDNPGKYTVTVRVHDDEGITDSDTAKVTVYGYSQPTADAGGPYYAMEQYGNEPDDPVQFDGSGSHDNDEHYFHNGSGYCIVNWTWDFGDGNTGYGETVSHSYADEGTYTVILTVTDNEGNTSSDTATAYISGYYPPIANPGGPYYDIEGEPIQFNGTGSYDNDEDGQGIVRYDWKFFDGDSWHNDIGVTPTHTYTADGTYTVTLRVWDDEDPSSYNISSTTVTITNYNDPTADAGGPYTGMAYVPITFDASDSYDNDEGGCCIIGYRWDWENDGIWDTGWLSSPITEHTYLLGFTGSVRVQVKDDDGSQVGYDEDTAQVTIAGNPPTADFSIYSTNNPSIFKFDASSSVNPRPGHDHYDLTYYWDFNNDGSWDKTGNWDTAGMVTWRYSTSGEKTIKLMVENPDGSDSATKMVHAFNYNDIVVESMNKNNFFLGYVSDIVAPTILNKYRFSTPEGVFDKVLFQLGDNSPVWDTSPGGSGEDIWEGVLTMNEGAEGDKVIVKGYKGGEVVWSTTLDVDILELPGWYQAFLTLCSCQVIQDFPDYTSWKLKVTIPHDKDLGLIMPEKNIPIKLIGGKYKFNAKIKPLTYSFILDDSGSFSISLVRATVPLGKQIKLGTYPKYSVEGGFSFSAVATLKGSRNGDVYLEGELTIGGEVTVKFKFPFFGIPFVAEVGVTGGMKAGFGISYSIKLLGSDGSSFSPADNVIVYSELGGSAGIYLEVLVGLASFEGGLEAYGKFYFRIPDVASRVKLYGGAYAEAKALWGLWSKKWTYGISWDSGWSGGRYKGFDISNLMADDANAKSITMRNMDLLSLKDFYRGIKCSKGRNIISGNVGEAAVPKIVLTDDNMGVAVWSDISLTENGSAVQSDIFWSVYDGNGWSPVESTNTAARCEFDPELVVVNDGVNEYVVLTYLAVDKVMNETTDVSTFYAEPRIHTAVWNNSNGWSFEGENLLIYGGTVNCRSVYVDDAGDLFMCFLKDTDCDPWENGIGTLFVVNGSIRGYDTGDEVNWCAPTLIRSFDDTGLGLQPRISFVNESVGGVVYPMKNISSNVTEVRLIPTVSGVTGFSNADLVIHVTNNSVSYVSSVVDNKSIVVFWVENNSQICQCVIDTDMNLSNWVVNPVEVVLSNVSVVSLKPVSFDGNLFLLFQSSELFTPCVIERLSDGSWGDLRQISLNEKYSLAQIDGDSNGDMSQIVYLCDTSLGEWLVGRWRFNEGNGSNVSDDSGFNNNGIILGDTTWVEQTNVTFDPVYGYGLRFNDTVSYVEIPYSSSFVVDNEFTTTCWVNFSNTSGENVIMGVNGSWLVYEGDGYLGVKLWRTDGFVDQSNITLLPSNTWVFIGVTYDHGVLRVVVRPNGLNNTTAMFDLGDYGIIDSGNPLILGGFKGCLDEVWLFNRDISMSEVDSIWFTPYPTLGSVHDVVVQHLPSFASFNFTTGRGDENVTTEDIVEFTGYPSGFIFDWDFGDGTFASGQNVSHQYNTGGFYTVICNVTDPSTGVVTPIMQHIYISDTTPPVFTGLQSIINGSNNATLSWNPANDTSSITYYGFMSNESGIYNFSSPCFVTRNTSYVVEGLNANETYYFIVQAFDAWGNCDNNTVELSVVPIDITPPLFDGLTNVYKIDNSPGCILLEWEKAVDFSPPILYNVYVSNVSGGQDFNNPVNSTNLTWCLVNGLDLGNESYYFVVRAVDVWGNEDDNTVELNITPIINRVPPVITNVVVAPSSQYDMGYVNISCNVVDDEDLVNLVKVEITGPPGHSTTNVTMNFCAGSTYYHNDTYVIPGSYQFFIWVNDTVGNGNSSDVYTFEIMQSLVAGFIYSPVNPSAGELVVFNSTSYDLNGVIVNWTWDFGDTTMAYGEQVVHQYDANGSYLVTLTVTDNDLNTESISRVVLVGEGVHVTDPMMGWNFVSVPFNGSVDKTGFIVQWDGYYYSWGQATSSDNPFGSVLVSPYLFGWDRVGQTYGFADTLDPGYGYWLYAYDGCELWLENMTLVYDDYLTDVEQKWNIISVPYNQSVDKTDIIVEYQGTDYSWSDAVSAGIISGYLFGWDRTSQSYGVADVLEPGYCYWMYAYDACRLKQAG